ncbi:MAG TPA: glycosyltransferase family 39 protein [Myxococcota bacterium]|nr:glycosyltransferase family 39 protein [Myxococcota bacterium]
MRRTALVALSLFAVAAAARILYVRSVWPHAAVRYPVLDCLAYHDWALSILAGDWQGTRVYYQDPLYPFFLAGLYALFGPDTLGVLIAQALLGAASVVVIAALAREIGGDAAGLVAGVLAAVYQVFFFFEALLLKGTLAVFVFSTALLLVARASRGGSPWRWLAPGFLLGLGCLLRPNALLFAPVLAFFAWRAPAAQTRARGAAAALALAGVAAAVGPVALRNTIVGGDFVLLNSQGGQNFYIGNFRGNASGIFVAPPFLRADPRYEEEDFRREAEREVGRELRPSEVSRYWMRRGLDEIAADPAHFARHLARKLVVFANAHEVADNESYEFFANHVSGFLRWPLPGWGALLPLALAGFALAWRRREAQPLIAFFAVYAAGLLPFFILSRLRLPLVPVVIAFAALALVQGPALLRRMPRARAAALVAALIVMLGATHLPVIQEDPVISHFNLAQAHRMRAKAERERAAALAAAGDEAGARAAFARVEAAQADAEAELRRGLEVAPRSARLRTALRNLQTTRIVELLRVGAEREALPIARAFAEEFPGTADAHARLGDVLERLGEREAAERAYRRALEIDPEHERARRALLALRAGSGS